MPEIGCHCDPDTIHPHRIVDAINLAQVRQVIEREGDIATS